MCCTVIKVTSPESFADLKLRPELLATLTDSGYEEPTPIQAAAIPVLIDGHDLLGQAATGTGKTAAFALPILQNLNTKSPSKNPTALVLVPTRELALQVSQAFGTYGKKLGVRLVAVYGGAPVRHQIDALRRGVDVVIATPGRALDLANRKVLKLDDVVTVVLDEADEMLEMGFIEDIETILALTPPDRQTVLFSATMPKRIDKLASKHLNHHHQRVSIKSSERVDDELPRVRQVAYSVTRANKSAALSRILDAEDPRAAIVFCRTRGGVDELAGLLTAQGYQAEALHGGLTQDQRDRVMGRLRTGATELLIATDVAARGLDVDLLTHVVNYDLPVSPEAYVHRIGRVGRAGREGTALSLVEPRERRLLASIEKLLGAKIPVEKIPTVHTVREMRLRRTQEAIESLLSDPDAQERIDQYRDILDEMFTEADAEEIALAAFALIHETSQSGGVADEVDFNIEESEFTQRQRKGDRSAKPGKKRERLSGPTTRVWLSLGRKAGITPGDVVGAITGEADLKGKDIGDISVHEMYSMVEVPSDKARKVVKQLQHVKIRGRKVVARLDRLDESTPKRKPRHK